MATVIRLQRSGAKKRPHYRIIITDNRKPRDGKYIECLGYYSPMKKEDNNFTIDLNRTDYWLSVGAKPSDTVNSIIKKSKRLVTNNS